MDLIFGLACDGRAYPDFPGDGAGALHADVVGPNGLIDILEVQLGLTGPRGAEAVRIAAYAAKLRATLTSGASPFFAASFVTFAWQPWNGPARARKDLIDIGRRRRGAQLSDDTMHFLIGDERTMHADRH